MKIVWLTLVFLLDLSNTYKQGVAGDDRYKQLREMRDVEQVLTPMFENDFPDSVTAQIGNLAHLSCQVREIGNKSVSWIRKRDSLILSVGNYTFISDDRIHVLHSSKTGSWTLQIKYLRAEDAGKYECQVSTEPKISHFVQLNVVVPLVEILNGKDLYVKQESKVTLKCRTTGAIEDPPYIFWYRNGQRISEHVTDSVVSQFELQIYKPNSNSTLSILTLPKVEFKDAGNYTCAPSKLPQAFVNLHVLKGETPAAMQREDSNKGTSVRKFSVTSFNVALFVSYSICMART